MTSTVDHVDVDIDDFYTEALDEIEYAQTEEDTEVAIQHLRDAKKYLDLVIQALKKKPKKTFVEFEDDEDSEEEDDYGFSSDEDEDDYEY